MKFEQQIEKTILECFKDIPSMSIDILRNYSISPFYQPDIVLKLKDSYGVEKIIICEYKSNGQPRIARSAIDQLLRYIPNDSQAYPVFAAPYISPRSAEICREQGVGYIDLAGNCRLAFDNVYVLKESKENPYIIKRELRSLFSPKAERVLRVLLNDPKVKWKTEELAKAAQVSLGQVSNVKKLLNDREWLDPAGLKLAGPERVLDIWSVNYQYSRNKVRQFYSFDKINEIEIKLAEECQANNIQYALTGFSAAARQVPFVRYQRATVYVSGDMQSLIDHLALKEVSSGANLNILTPYDDGVFYGSEDYEGIQLVSVIQNYLDLQGISGRGEEAAQALLEEVIRKRW